jgi:hypothetical protein
MIQCEVQDPKYAFCLTFQSIAGVATGGWQGGASILPSLLFLSPASSSRLSASRFVAAGTLLGLSTGILFFTYALSPPFSTAGSILSSVKPASQSRLTIDKVFYLFSYFLPVGFSPFQVREGAGMLGSSNRTILLYIFRNCRPASVLWYFVFPPAVSVWTRSFDFNRLKYCPDCLELILQ